ncbi:FAD-dependent monooxygenase [Actinocorallia aurea]
MDLNAPAVRVADLPTIDTEVLVVGAGPTGLMAGLVCAARGLPALVVDKKTGPTRESRALAVQARTMELYDQLDVAQPVLDGANPVVRLRIGAGGGPLGFGFAELQQDATRFPGVKIFEQSRNERLLVDALAERGGEVAWGHRLVDLVDRTREDGPDGRVEALLEGPDGLVVVRARWCVGADGAASTVRREIDLPFEGVTDDATFWVADLHDISGIPDDAISGRFGAETFAITFPLGPGGHARLIALAPHDSITQEAALQAAREDLGLAFGRVDWFSTYRVHHRVASRFRLGSVFLAGDAAHVHSPIGGQGMNTGLQDAHNLALLLADVAQGHLDPSALDRYERERRPVAEKLINVTDRAFGVIGRRGKGVSLFRNRFGFLAARLLPRITRSRLGPRLGGYLGQYRIRYHYLPGGPAPAWALDPAVGRRLPPSDANDEPLRSLTWQLHTYGGAPVARPARPPWIEGPHAFAADPHQGLRADRLYLIRPDGFVAAALPVIAGAVDQHALDAAVAAHRLLV